MVLFFFNDTATTEIYTLSLHDALPIFRPRRGWQLRTSEVSRSSSASSRRRPIASRRICCRRLRPRSEEHTSELQSRLHLVCRLLLEKKKRINRITYSRPQLQAFEVHT